VRAAAAHTPTRTTLQLVCAYREFKNTIELLLVGVAQCAERAADVASPAWRVMLFGFRKAMCALQGNDGRRVWGLEGR
jgi:hypothetical protein